LSRFARHAEAARSARTFVTTYDGKVVGYYALAIGQVNPEAATTRLKQGQPAERPVSMLLLARLAVDRDHQRNGVGRSLLEDALLQCSAIAERVGVPSIVAHTNDAAAPFYDQFGFERSPTDPLHRVLPMKDLLLLLDELGVLS